MAFALLLLALTLEAQDRANKQEQQLRENALWSPGRNFDPNLGLDQWRFVPYIGWRKFAPTDAFYKDFRDYTRFMRFRPFPWWPN